MFGPGFITGINVENSSPAKDHVVNYIELADLDADGRREIIQSTTGGVENWYEGAYIEKIYFDEDLIQLSNQIV